LRVGTTTFWAGGLSATTKFSKEATDRSGYSTSFEAFIRREQKAV
jgi:hypothetical protein